ncbi:MAG TPA: 30S ribosomal protein S12 methylthiotransferase RimO, partial [Legionellales bacterium]|nr:30S ribosomal protein S12 methylthiotransferase RimO [Legionellales bacterium]
DFIVGFPGETTAEFAELLEFLEQAQLDRVGCFQYSPVKGAKANELANPLPDHIKQTRFHEFMTTQARISHKRLARHIGTTQTVLIDTITDEHIIARSKSDAPEIDGLVYLPSHPKIEVGSLVDVTITHNDEYDLFATYP